MWSGGILPKLAALGHPVVAVGPIPDGATVDDHGLQRAGLEVRRYRVPYFDTDPFANTDRSFYETQRQRITEEIVPLLAAGRADVILVGNESFIPGLPELAGRYAIPTVAMVHTVYWADEAGPSRANFSRRHTLENLAACDRIVCVAQHAVAVLARLGLAHASAIPNAVDLEMFRPRPCPDALAVRHRIAAGAPVIAHVANLKPIKESWRLLRAAPMILERHPAAIFLLMGEGPCRDELIRLQRELGLERQVQVLGWIDHARLPEYYALADLVALTSASEGAPFVFLEALASGCGVVSAPIAAAREFLGGMPGTLLAGSHEPADIAGAVCRLLGEVQGRQRREEIARVAAARFDLAEAARRFSALIDSVPCRAG